MVLPKKQKRNGDHKLRGKEEEDAGRGGESDWKQGSTHQFEKRNACVVNKEKKQEMHKLLGDVEDEEEVEEYEGGGVPPGDFLVEESPSTASINSYDQLRDPSPLENRNQMHKMERRRILSVTSVDLC